jgi:hypothetical protein
MMTVGELRQALDDLNPDTLVVVDSTEDWYSHVTEVLRPETAFEGTDGYQALTLVVGLGITGREGGLYVEQPWPESGPSDEERLAEEPTREELPVEVPEEWPDYDLMEAWATGFEAAEVQI